MKANKIPDPVFTEGAEKEATNAQLEWWKKQLEAEDKRRTAEMAALEAAAEEE